MLIYVVTFYVIVFFFFLNPRLDTKVRRYFQIFSVIYFLWFVGFRHSVGGDWESYLYHFQNLKLSVEEFVKSLFSLDPGYVLVEYIARVLGLGIYGVNTVCAFLFFLGLTQLINAFKIKMREALLVAFPYLIMVVANGYTRQSAALGLTMSALSYFKQGKLAKSVISFALAVLFHKSALIAVAIYLIKPRSFRPTRFILYLIGVITVTTILFKVFESRYSLLYEYYFKERMHSSGGVVRIAINMVASIVLFLFSRQWKKRWDDFAVWEWFSYITIVVLVSTLLTRTTTLGDRLLLYFYPLQIVVFPKVAKLISDKALRALYLILLTAAYSAVLFVWLFSAVHRDSWIPYNNLLFMIWR